MSEKFTLCALCDEQVISNYIEFNPETFKYVKITYYSIFSEEQILFSFSAAKFQDLIKL